MKDIGCRQAYDSRNYKAYYEVLDYGKVLRDAQRRNAALFDKLKLA